MYKDNSNFSLLNLTIPVHVYCHCRYATLYLESSIGHRSRVHHVTTSSAAPHPVSCVKVNGCQNAFTFSRESTVDGSTKEDNCVDTKITWHAVAKPVEIFTTSGNAKTLDLALTVSTETVSVIGGFGLFSRLGHLHLFPLSPKPHQL